MKQCFIIMHLLEYCTTFLIDCVYKRKYLGCIWRCSSMVFYECCILQPGACVHEAIGFIHTTIFFLHGLNLRSSCPKKELISWPKNWKLLPKLLERLTENKLGRICQPFQTVHKYSDLQKGSQVYCKDDSLFYRISYSADCMEEISGDFFVK